MRIIMKELAGTRLEWLGGLTALWEGSAAAAHDFLTAGDRASLLPACSVGNFVG